MDEAEFWRIGPKVLIDRDAVGNAAGIHFQPERGDAIPVPFQRLFAKVSGTLLTITATLPADTLAAIRKIAPSTNDGESQTKVELKLGGRDRKLRARLHNDIEALGAIARLGWEHGRIPEALGLLEQFRTDFAGRETSAIWGKQLREVGAVAFAVTVVLVAVHFGLQQLSPGTLGQFENIVLLAAGAPIGFWVSYAIAPIPPAEFDALPALQLERRAGLIGLVFVLLVSVIMGLLIVTGAITITVGNLSTAIAQPGQAASAVLIGMLCGFIRPAIVTARASAFVKAMDTDRGHTGATDLSRRVEDLLSEIPQRAADVLARGEAGQALTRTVTTSVSQAIDTSFATLPGRTAEALTTSTELRRSFQESVRTALEPPQSVKYRGRVIIEIVRNTDAVDLIKIQDGRPSVEFVNSGDYQLRIHFETGDPTATSGAEIPLTIDDGLKATNVPFELRIDIGISREPRRRRNVTVPSSGRSEDFEFPFTLNGPTDLEADYPMAITVYQHAVRWGTCLVSVSAPSADA